MSIRDRFHELDQAFGSGGVAAALQLLARDQEASGNYHELFEILKMQVRHRLGLPLLFSTAESQQGDVDESVRAELEKGLLAACRRVGFLLLEEGRLRDAWLYLRPLDDQAAVLERLNQVEPTQENVDELIELCLHEGLDLDRGFALMLQHHGTCNSITTFESAMYGKPRNQRAIGAARLLDHLYQELVENVVAHIQRQEGEAPPSDRLTDLMKERDWLFAEGSYHIDTTHLSSVVRFARDLSDPTHLRKALELTDYGRSLEPQYQYPAEAPFENFYDSHAAYFRVLLQQDDGRHLDGFRRQAEQVDLQHENTFAIEVYIDLLARIGRTTEAMSETVRLIPPETQTMGLAPNLLELAQAGSGYQLLCDVCRQRDELFGYALGLLRASDQRPS